MGKSAPPTVQKEFDVAEARGTRVKDLFPAGNQKFMKDIIKALKQEDLYVADPVNEESGKSDFFQTCWAAIDYTNFPGANKAEKDANKADFINDLWIETQASRGAQEARPCW